MRPALPLAVFAFPLLLWPQLPSIEITARNAASYAYPVAPGALFVVTGFNLGPNELVQASAYPLPVTLAGTSVEVSVGGTTIPAYMVYTSSRQIAAVLPSRAPAGEGTLTVTWNGGRSFPRSITVARSHFGIFTSNASGRGGAAVQNILPSGLFETNQLNRPARPRQPVTLYGTGMGMVEGDEGSRPFPAALANGVPEVYVGGQRADVLYAGRSGCCPGVDQLNFVIPEDVEGCHVPVLVKADGVLSNTATVAIARPDKGACSDAFGRTTEELIAARESGALAEADIVLRHVSTVEQIGPSVFWIEADFGFASFRKMSFEDLQLSTGFSILGPPPTAGACYTWAWGGFVHETIGPAPVDIVPVRPLDAGPSLTVTAPKGARTLVKKTDGSYEADLSSAGGPVRSPFLEPGPWTIQNGQGGLDIGPFEARVRAPAFMQWTNEGSTSVILRSQGYEAQWTGADPNSMVTVTGRSAGTAGIAFSCFERGDAGRLSVPAYILEAAPNVGYLGVAFSTTSRFTAPGLAAGRITYVNAREKPVILR